jgi:hypothetical protein
VRARLTRRDYRAKIAAIRSARNREVARANAGHWQRIDRILAEANREIAKRTAARDSLIRELREQGLSTAAIAAEVGCSRSRVYEFLIPIAGACTTRGDGSTGMSTAEAGRRERPENCGSSRRLGSPYSAGKSRRVSIARQQTKSIQSDERNC